MSEKKCKIYPCISLVVQKIALPLHSLSGTNELTSRLSTMILETIPYRQAVQRSLSFFFRTGSLSVK